MKKNDRIAYTVWVAIFPLLVGIVPSILLYVCKHTYKVERFDFVMNGLITCAATFTGFILTSLSILLGALNSPLMKYIVEHNGMAEMKLRYSMSLILGVLLIAFCVFLGIVTPENETISKLQMSFGSFITISFFVCISLTGYYLFRMVALLHTKPKATVDNNPSFPRPRS